MQSEKLYHSERIERLNVVITLMSDPYVSWARSKSIKCSISRWDIFGTIRLVFLPTCYTSDSMKKRWLDFLLISNSHHIGGSYVSALICQRRRIMSRR